MKSSARCLLVVAFALGACGDDATSTPAQCTLTCTNPPASECVGSALRSYASPGACSGAAPDFVCTYGFVDYACENGCEAGACKGVVDPCADVVCNAPPAARCDGDQLETFTNLGTCDGGTCSYGSVKLPCTQGCADGACAGDPCADVVCNAPPSTCHAATGTCSSGVCSYPVLTGAACDDGVACTEDDTCGSNAVCMGDAIACQSPPAPVCDGNTLKVAAATGTCAAGACDYAVTDVVCADGCSNGACLGNPCANVVCDSPPTPCHVDSGTCQNGVCAYAFDNGASCDDGVACTEGDTCTNGVCGGTVRTCVTPPAAACKDAETLVVNASAGSCADGACSYVGIDVPCAFGCVTVDGVGRCEGDPCGGGDRNCNGTHKPTLKPAKKLTDTFSIKSDLHVAQGANGYLAAWTGVPEAANTIEYTHIAPTLALDGTIHALPNRVASGVVAAYSPTRGAFGLAYNVGDTGELNFVTPSGALELASPITLRSAVRGTMLWAGGQYFVLGGQSFLSLIHI